MNKGDLIARMAADAGITRSQATAAINSVLESVNRSLRAGKKVTIVGFGTFSTGKRKARMGRNPQTGRSIRIPARKVARFTAGKQLKKSVNR